MKYRPTETIAIVQGQRVLTEGTALRLRAFQMTIQGSGFSRAPFLFRLKTAWAILTGKARQVHSLTYELKTEPTVNL
jgi:hypothetical protein